MSNRLPCPYCNSQTGYQSFDDGQYCHKCHRQTKEKQLKLKSETIKVSKKLQDYSLNIPKLGMNYLKKYRITDKSIKRFKIGWSEEFQRLVFPYYLDYDYKFSWMRDPTGLKYPKWLYNKGRKDMPYWFHHGDLYVHDNCQHFNSLIITEDVISAIRCYEGYDILALGGTNFEKESISEIILQYNRIILWLDGDKAGRTAAKKFCKKWSPWREVIDIRTKKDPKEFSTNEIKEILNARERV